MAFLRGDDSDLHHLVLLAQGLPQAIHPKSAEDYRNQQKPGDDLPIAPRIPRHHHQQHQGKRHGGPQHELPAPPAASGGRPVQGPHNPGVAVFALSDGLNQPVSERTKPLPRLFECFSGGNVHRELVPNRPAGEIGAGHDFTSMKFRSRSFPFCVMMDSG